MRRSGFWKIFAAGAFLASLVVTILGSGIARAASEVDFFKGKTITYIVATKPGGGYDTNARLISKHMEKYLGATIVIKNVPGAGHIIGANQIYAAKPDGLTFGTFNTGLIYAQLVNQPGIKFDLRKFTWIGKASSEARVLVVNVPLASDIVPAKGNGLINLISATAEISRFTAGPPGIPAVRAQFLIEAYRKALTDPELLAQAQKAELPIDPLYGQEVARQPLPPTPRIPAS